MTAPDVHLKVLGEVSVVGPAGSAAVGPVAERLLRLLALRYPETVPVDVAAHELYAGTPTVRARRALHSAVWRLRRQLPDGTIVTDGDGYRLGLEPEQVDLLRLEHLARTGRVALLTGELEAAAERCGAAMALWPDATPPTWADRYDVGPRLAVLAAAHAGAVEDWAEASLRLGRAREAVGPLARLVDREPLRERAWALLLDAHRHAEQWGDVAETAARARGHLTEVGVEPGPELAAALARAEARGEQAPPAAPRDPLPTWLRVAADQGPFVGRAEERDTLLAAVHDAASGHSRLLVIAGEPGIGKTRLAAEVALLAAGRGVQVWAGRCDQQRIVPYDALLPMVRHLLGRLDPALDAVRPGSPAHALVRAEVDRGAQLDAASEQLALFESLADLVRTATAHGPAVLVMDDIQWAGQGTLRFLRHLLHHDAGISLTVVATMRTGPWIEPADEDLLVELMQSTRARRLELHGLTTHEVAAHPDLVAGDDDRLALAERVRAMTGGNPLFLTELLARSAATAGGIEDAVDAARQTLRHAVNAHLGRLDEPTRRLLALAAASGPDVEPDLLRRAAARTPVAMPTEAVHRALDAAEQAGILLAHPDGWYQFRHELLQQALLDELPAASKAGLHLALADALADAPDADRPPHLFHRASQLQKAGAVADPTEVLEVSRLAARTATAAIDFANAARSFEAAARAAERLGSPEHAELLVESAMSWRCAGDVQAMLSLAREAATAARRNGWTEEFARAVVAIAEHEVQLDGRVHVSTQEQLDLAIELLADTDRQLAGRLRYLANVEYHAGMEPGMVTLVPALEVFAGDPEFVDVLARAFWDAGPADRPSLAARIAAAAADDPTPRNRALSIMTTWFVAIEEGRAGIDDPVGAELDALVDSVPDDADLQWLRGSWHAGRHLAAGRLGPAATDMAECYQRARASELPVGRLAQTFAAHRVHRYVLGLLSEPPERIIQIAAPYERLATADPVAWDRLVAMCYLVAGRIDEARAAFEGACDATLEPGRVMPCPVTALSMLGRTAAMIGDPERGRAILEALAPWRGHQAMFRHFHVNGAVTTPMGLINRLLGDLDTAVDLLVGAREQNIRQGVLVWATTTGVDLVETLLVRDGPGDRAEAEALARSLRPTVTTFGMFRAAERLDGALAR